MASTGQRPMKKIRLKNVVIFACISALAYAGICTYFWMFQREKIFEPSALIQSTPDRVGLKFSAVHIPAGHGSEAGKLAAWWIAAEQKNAPTLLYLHGNYRNISHNLEHAARLHQMGFNLLLVDYRGFGESAGGQASEAKVYEDAETAWQYLIQQQHISASQTFIYGHSLGGAIATELALHHPEAAGLIIESSFSSMQAMGELNFGYLQINFLLNQRFDTLQKIEKLPLPVLIIHGTWDKKTPVYMAQQLYEHAPEPKFIKLIEGGEHSNNSGIATVEYRAAFTTFTQRYFK